MLFKSPGEVLREIGFQVQRKRLERNWTQAKPAHHANLSLSVLRKFEQTGKISLESFVKLAYVLDFSEELLESVKLPTDTPDSMDELLSDRKTRKRMRASTK